MDGIILVNKERGMTSHDVVSKIRKILKTKEVGHAGTLDPMATGVLVVLVGKGTKLSKYLIEHDKSYIATVKLGEKTDTGDCEGNIVERKKFVEQSPEKIEEILRSFIGKQIQIPPMYSAIKVNGKKLYEYARAGESVEVPKREIEIYKIELIEIHGCFITFKVFCSKGTYIRTLCEDIAVRLGTVGTMTDLKRTSINRFNIEDAVTIDRISEKVVIPIDKVLEGKEKIELSDTEFGRFLNGIGIESGLDIALVYNNDRFRGVACNKKGKLIRDIIVDFS